MASLLFIFFVALCICCNGNRGEWGQIKINEPKAGSQSSNSNNHNNNNNYGGNSQSSSSTSSSTYRDPHSVTENSEIVSKPVVEYLASRKDEIIEGKFDKYTYKMELFSKVTQSENWYSWNLGIFDKWDYCDGDDTKSEICLVYSNGQKCGSGAERSSHVHIVCDIGDRDASKEQLFDISEPQTCSYHLNMYVPKICEIVKNDISKIMAKNIDNDDNKNDAKNEMSVGNAQSHFVTNPLSDLWRLCLLSLMVKDETRLDKIKKVAKVYMVKHEVTNDKEEIDICDVYLNQMSGTEHSISNEMDEGETVIGGLIGEMLNDENKNEQKIKNEDENGVIVDEFKGDKVVFQSGNNDNDKSDVEAELAQMESMQSTEEGN